MRASPITRILGAVVVTAGAAVFGVSVPSASAQQCPDVEAVFARGTSEPPGVGGVGQAFVDQLRCIFRTDANDIDDVCFTYVCVVQDWIG